MGTNLSRRQKVSGCGSGDLRVLVHLEAAWNVVGGLLVSDFRLQAPVDAPLDEVWTRRGNNVVP